MIYFSDIIKNYGLVFSFLCPARPWVIKINEKTLSRNYPAVRRKSEG